MLLKFSNFFENAGQVLLQLVLIDCMKELGMTVHTEWNRNVLVVVDASRPEVYRLNVLLKQLFCLIPLFDAIIGYECRRQTILRRETFRAMRQVKSLLGCHRRFGEQSRKRDYICRDNLKKSLTILLFGTVCRP